MTDEFGALLRVPWRPPAPTTGKTDKTLTYCMDNSPRNFFWTVAYSTDPFCTTFRFYRVPNNTCTIRDKIRQIMVMINIFRYRSKLWRHHEIDASDSGYIATRWRWRWRRWRRRRRQQRNHGQRHRRDDQRHRRDDKQRGRRGVRVQQRRSGSRGLVLALPSSPPAPRQRLQLPALAHPVAAHPVPVTARLQTPLARQLEWVQ